MKKSRVTGVSTVLLRCHHSVLFSHLVDTDSFVCLTMEHKEDVKYSRLFFAPGGNVLKFQLIFRLLFTWFACLACGNT